MKLTVGDVRKAIADLDDAIPVYPGWTEDVPDDNEPRVKIDGVSFQTHTWDGVPDEPHLSIHVSLVYGNDQECEVCGEHGDDCDCDEEPRRYAIVSEGNGARWTITRIGDGKSIFLQGDDAVEFGRRLDRTTAEFTDDELCEEYSALFV